jgi:GNAT superfamily N-acetyltransferase
MKQHFQIRNARPDEHDALRDMTLAAYEQYAPVMPHWAMYRDHLLSTLANNDRAERIVAVQQHKIIGSVLLEAGDTMASGVPSPELRLLAVAPWARGVGVGRALLEECIARARRGGARALHLHTEDIMAVAQQMYLRRGFVRAPDRDFSPAAGELVKGYRLQLDAADDAPR